MEEHLDRLQGSKVFCLIDLKNGFFHVPIHEDSCKFTSFVTPSGQFEFLRVPFGFCNAPSIFQRFINKIFADFIAQGFMLAYFDDIVVMACSIEEALERLTKILQRAEEYGLVINWSKCQFLTTKINYLGYEVEDSTIRPSEGKIIAVKNYPVPTTAKQLQSYLGLTSYFRKFIMDYAIIARPLSELLKKDRKFVWGHEQNHAFQRLKDILSTSPVLNIFKIGAPTELHTDASIDGIGAILLQEDESDHKLHPIHYLSRKTNDAQRKWANYFLEVFAVVEAVRKFRHYLVYNLK